LHQRDVGGGGGIGQLGEERAVGEVFPDIDGGRVGGLADGFLEFCRVVPDGGDCAGEPGDGPLLRRLAQAARGATLRANEDETPAPREFRLEGAEGSPRTCPCPSP